MSSVKYSIIADIGGTNARFALLEEGQKIPFDPVNLVCSDYKSITDAVRAYMDLVPFAKPVKAAIAIATPVVDDNLNMTNHSWQFSVSETRHNLGLQELKVLNDFTALALAVPYLADEKFHKVGDGDSQNKQVKAVIGPGTGLGVSGIIPIDGKWYPIQGEGGHVSYGPLNDNESAIIEQLRGKMGHVSAEALVSGSGLSLLYETLKIIETGQAEKLDAKVISKKAMDGVCPIATKALSIFCEILGTVAGNLALTLGARGGVYIGGGIIPSILDFFTDSDFRNRFENHGRFTDYLRDISTHVIIAEYPALLGAAYSLNPEYKTIGATSIR